MLPLDLHEDTEGPPSLQPEGMFLGEVNHPAVSDGVTGPGLGTASFLVEDGLEVEPCPVPGLVQVSGLWYLVPGLVVETTLVHAHGHGAQVRGVA